VHQQGKILQGLQKPQNRFKIELKEILTTPEGWFSWFIANVITSLHWVIPTIIGFITKDTYWFTTAASLWAIGLSPFVPLFVFNIAIAIWFKNILLKNKRVIIIQGDKTNGK
jgi:hypothetical protein